ncbi:hypothetical protein U0070_024615 [Myodes glareolus]|uniref:Uncharacterized protein n=1 Tax=Myodes glareolus TaxID=447135 RepID=A0AAW0JXN7_MYOGA
MHLPAAVKHTSQDSAFAGQGHSSPEARSEIREIYHNLNTSREADSYTSGRLSHPSNMDKKHHGDEHHFDSPVTAVK